MAIWTSYENRLKLQTCKYLYNEISQLLLSVLLENETMQSVINPQYPKKNYFSPFLPFFQFRNDSVFKTKNMSYLIFLFLLEWQAIKLTETMISPNGH